MNRLQPAIKLRTEEMLLAEIDNYLGRENAASEVDCDDLHEAWACVKELQRRLKPRR